MASPTNITGETLVQLEADLAHVRARLDEVAAYPLADDGEPEQDTLDIYEDLLVQRFAIEKAIKALLAARA